MFDVNDFDETLPAPWEWDVKRLVASVAVAAHENGAGMAAAKAAAQHAAAMYRGSMHAFAADGALDVWYAHIDVEDLARASRPARRSAALVEKQLRKIRGRTSRQVVGKLAERVDGELRFKSLPPLITPLRELVRDSGADADQVHAVIAEGFAAYRRSLAPERRLLLDRYRMVDIARKVVGVGSVGTLCFIVLFVGRDENDPLVLQFKEADASVLEPYAGRSAYRHRGARVINGQRMVQIDGDLFLGWNSLAQTGQHFYWRQLKDMKASAEIALLDAKAFDRYVSACAWCLANAHARSGDPVAIDAYLGTGRSFDRAMAAFAAAYARQTTEDWEALSAAIEDGRIEAVRRRLTAGHDAGPGRLRRPGPAGLQSVSRLSRASSTPRSPAPDRRSPRSPARDTHTPQSPAPDRRSRPGSGSAPAPAARTRRSAWPASPARRC